MINFPVAADIRIKHGKLWSWLKENNMSIPQLARTSGIHLGLIYRYVNMTDYPRTEITRSKLEIATGIPCEELFPYNYTQFINSDKKKNRRFTVIKEIPLAMLPGVNFHEALPSPEKLLSEREDKTYLEEALSHLTPREEDMICMRFGIGIYEGKPKTLDQIAKIYNLGRERIRQIEKRSLEKLEDALEKKGYKPFWTD